MIRRGIRYICVLAAVAMTGTALADAAAIPVGDTNVLIAALIKGNAVGYDSTNHVYLTVGTYGKLYGRFVAADGTPLGNPFVIQASTNFTHSPSVAFSPDADGGAGGFLVAWHESDLPGGSTSVHTRIVSYNKSGPAGADNQINTDGSWWNSHVTVAYGSVNKEFVVAFALVHPVYGIRANRVDNSGAAVAPSFTVVEKSQFEDNPGIAYDPNTNQFLVSYSGYDPVGGFAFVDSRLVQGGSSQLVGASATRLGVTVGTWITAVTFNPQTNKYLVVWFGANLVSTGTYGRQVNADGTVSGSVILVSARWKCHDGLDVAYNVNSNSYFVISCDVSSSEDGGVELDSNAQPLGAGFMVTNADAATGDTNDEGGNFQPRITASTDDPNWLMTASNSYTSLVDQLITSGPVSTPVMSVDLPSTNTTVSPAGFLIAGWAIDEGATTSTGIDVVAAWAFPASGGAPILAGVAQLGYSRPDVAAIYGSQFSTAGFGLFATLPIGTYNLAVYSHSTISGQWSTPTVITITVGVVSNPHMSLDAPANGATVAASGFLVGGWAIDLGAPAGTGVDVVDVWAYPSTGATPVLVGVAPTGGSRPDVGAAFGSSRFAPSGFVVAGATLPVGDYLLVAFAHSTLTGTFNDVATANIHVR